MTSMFARGREALAEGVEGEGVGKSGSARTRRDPPPEKETERRPLNDRRRVVPPALDCRALKDSAQARRLCHHRSEATQEIIRSFAGV
jgi:hypothetical protein